MPLKGICIGNGLTEPEEQYDRYADVALDGCLEKGAIANPLAHAAMKAAVGTCVNQIHSCSANETDACTTAYATCCYVELIPHQLTGYSPYGVRIKCAVSPFCYDFSNVGTFLNARATQQQLGVNAKRGSCNLVANIAFQHGWMLKFHTEIPFVLGDGVKVSVYAGGVDYVCNWLGNKKWTLALEWPRKAEFNTAANAAYSLNGKPVGRLHSSNGFTSRRCSWLATWCPWTSRL